jgi:hypothetical protein
MIVKKCIICGTEKPLDAFYLHPMMKDGRLNKCSECCRAYASERYSREFKKIREYERRRFKSGHRKQKVLEYQRKRRARAPLKEKARRLISYYVRSGKIEKLPCEECGDQRSEAHHEDYGKPLQIIWLCHFHHRLREGRLHNFDSVRC